MVALNHEASAADVPSAMPVKAQTQSDDKRWTATFNQETDYYSWQSSVGYSHLANQPTPDPTNRLASGRGSQVYSPYGLQVDGKPGDDWQVQFLIRSGYFWSRQSIGTVSGETSGPTDTTLGTTVTYNGWAGIQPFVSLNMNLPTGSTVLKGNSAFARPDPDLSAIPTFGEGLNIGPTAGLNIAITPTLVGSLSAGYTSRSPYDRESPIVLGVQGINRVEPSSLWTGNAAIAYQANGLSLQFSGSYAVETETSIDGKPVYKTGNKITVTGAAGYAWSDAWSSQVQAAFVHTDKNLFPNLTPPPPGLILEMFNSNSNITQVSLSTTYRQGNFAIGPTASFMYRDRNDWDMTADAFLPAKTSYAAGGMAQYMATQQIMITLRGEHRWTHENENPDKIVLPGGVQPGTGFPAISSTGWMASLGGTIKF